MTYRDIGVPYVAPLNKGPPRAANQPNGPT